LVFERTVDDNADIYVMPVDGGELTRLTDDPGWDGEPAWSPDGSQIVFASERAGGPAIYVMNSDGSSLRALTDPAAASLTPAWSPDGKQIAFASIQPAGQEGNTGFEIWVVNVDGSGLRRVAGSPSAQLLSPAWGPKSDRLVYAQRAGAAGSLLIQQLGDESAPKPLAVAAEGAPGAPAWSPNGSRIAYALERQGRVELWQSKPDGGAPHLLGQTGPGGGEPAWSPDGKHIVFVSDQDGVRSLAIMDLNGNAVRQFPADGALLAHPDWHDSSAR
jgi:Tol biopolymer transport system component